MVCPKQWVFVLTAVAVIFTANLTPLASLINFFIFSALIQLTYFMIIGIHLIVPKRSDKILDGLYNWIKNNFRPVVIGFFSGFEIFFLVNTII